MYILLYISTVYICRTTANLQREESCQQKIAVNPNRKNSCLLWTLRQVLQFECFI